jgi:predicted metal-dependent hydrolase
VSGNQAQACPPELLQGIAEYNRGEFYQCHDTLEELWATESQPIRYLYQGILQIGMAFYHLRAQRYRPVVSLLTSGSRYLTPFAPDCLGVNVSKLLDDAAHCLNHVQQLGPDRLNDFDWSLVPKVEMVAHSEENRE